MVEAARYEPFAIAADADGNTYITGGTASRSFPVTNGSTRQDTAELFDFGGFCGTGPNIFVAKLDPTGKVVYASYGGVGAGSAIALDSSGVYFTGETFPPDIDNIIGYSNNNNGDSFVWRLESKGGLQDYFQIFGSGTGPISEPPLASTPNTTSGSRTANLFR